MLSAPSFEKSGKSKHMAVSSFQKISRELHRFKHPPALFRKQAPGLETNFNDRGDYIPRGVPIDCSQDSEKKVHLSTQNPVFRAVKSYKPQPNQPC